MSASYDRPLIRFDGDDTAPDWTVPPSRPTLTLRCDDLAQGATLREAQNDSRSSSPSPLGGFAVSSALALIERDAREKNRKWVGFLDYDLVHAFEDLPTRERENTPLFHFSALRNPDGGAEIVDEVKRRSLALMAQHADRFAPSSTFTREEYLRVVGRAKRYIAAGDVFQVNLSQRFRVETARSAAEIYEALLAARPRYAALLDFGDVAFVSQSPELFFRVDVLPDGRRRIVSRPIKGTRPLVAGMAETLRGSIKDQAELAMIVDLQRNDLGRVCEIGSVRVTEPRTIEPHATVYHAVATIEGTLRPEVTLPDILGAVFPCGSITGCPKIRAMQIIHELEPVARGVYCGAIGRVNPDGSMIFSVAIRTITLRGNIAHVPVGGGIVADSDPTAEYEETLVKARGMLAALGVPSQPFSPLVGLR